MANSIKIGFETKRTKMTKQWTQYSYQVDTGDNGGFIACSFACCTNTDGATEWSAQQVKTSVAYPDGFICDVCHVITFPAEEK